MKLSSAKLRIWLRAFHLLGMMPLAFVIYMGPDQAGFLLQVVRFVIFPSFLLTGLTMWQMPKLNKWLHSREKNLSHNPAKTGFPY
jgi:hypothetical protein